MNVVTMLDFKEYYKDRYATLIWLHIAGNKYWLHYSTTAAVAQEFINWKIENAITTLHSKERHKERCATLI